MPRRGGRHFVILSGAERAMEAFKEEIASDLGLGNKVKTGGWTVLTTQEVGTIGGEMVKRLMIAGELVVLSGYEKGLRLSPDIPADVIINNSDPRRKVTKTQGETIMMSHQATLEQ